jgi:hypothetical protein
MRAVTWQGRLLRQGAAHPVWLAVGSAIGAARRVLRVALRTVPCRGGPADRSDRPGRPDAMARRSYAAVSDLSVRRSGERGRLGQQAAA